MNKKKIFGRFAVVIILSVIFSLTGCGKTHHGQKNVIFITVDTTRMDYLGIYGMDKIQTPNIDALARDSVVFKHCYSVTNTTIPSHTSLFTSLYLKDHEVISMGQVLPQFDDFLPKIYKRAGYKTAAFTSGGHLSPVINIDQGFDDFFFPEKNENIAQITIDKVINWLDVNRGVPFFIWTHLFDPHEGYTPPAPYNTMYKYTSDKTFDDYEIKGKLRRERFEKVGYAKVSNDPEYFRNLYKGEISYMDSQIGRLVSHLKELGIYDSSVVVLVADHGEYLGEHGLFFTHGGGLYDEVTHVPMFIKMPHQAQKGYRNQLVSSIDIYPTLLDIFGLKISNPIRGKSLISVINDKNAPEIRDSVYFESVWQMLVGERTQDYTYIRPLNDVLEFKTVDGFMFPEKSKFVENADGRQLLFDNKTDQAQEKNIARDKKKIVAKFEQDILKFAADTIRPKDKPHIVTDRKQLDKLKALGYMK